MRIIKKSVLSVCLLLAGSLTLGAAWTTKRLTNNPVESDFPDIVVNKTKVYAVWEDHPGNEEIYFKRSADGGATWRAAKRLTNSAGTSVCPKIAVSDSNIYVVWEENTSESSEIYFIKSVDCGTKWETARRLTNNAGNSQSPAIAVNGVNVFVVWNASTGSGINDIYFRKSTDGGATWQTARKLTNNTVNVTAYNPRIAVSGTNVYVVWYGGDYWGIDDLEMYFRKSTDGGATWRAARKVSDNEGASLTPAIAVSRTNVYLVWEGQIGYGDTSIYFRKSADEGETWQTVIKLTSNPGTYLYPAIAANGHHLCVVWVDDISGNGNGLYFRESANSGATWRLTKNLTNNLTDSWCPQIAIGGSMIYVLWAYNWDIYLKYSPL